MGNREHDDIGRLIFERTLQLIALDRLLREQGLPGVLAYPPAQLRALEAQLLGLAPTPDAAGALGQHSLKQEQEAPAPGDEPPAAPADRPAPATLHEGPADALPRERSERRLRQLRALRVLRGGRADRIGQPGYPIDG